MSWTMSTGPVSKADAEAAIDNAQRGALNAAAAKQFAAAKQVALELLKSVPGPKVIISLSGHANGTGETVPAGWAPDYIDIRISQVDFR